MQSLSPCRKDLNIANGSSQIYNDPGTSAKEMLGNTLNIEALTKFKVDGEAIEKIRNYLSDTPLTEKTIIHKRQSLLPFSLAYNPVEEKVYLKTRGLPPVGFGSSCNLVAGVDLNTHSKVVYRSMPTRDVNRSERDINIQLSDRPDLFVATKDIYEYQGSFSCKSPEDGKNESAFCKKMPNRSKTCFILEQMDKDLYELLDPSIRLSFQDKVEIACDIAKALDVLHNEYAVVHRDLKVENIFILNLPGNKKYLAKIGDFGHSEYAGKVPKLGAGTEEYWPPEWLSNTEALPKAQLSSDIWSFGVLLLLLFGEQAIYKYWSDLDDNEEIIASKSAVDKDRLIETIDNDGSVSSDKIVSLIKRCLERDPKLRIVIEEIVEILENVKDSYRGVEPDKILENIKNSS